MGPLSPVVQLHAGARIAIIPEDIVRMPSQLASSIVAAGITHFTTIPRVWQALLPHLASAAEAGALPASLCLHAYGQHADSASTADATGMYGDACSCLAAAE